MAELADAPDSKSGSRKRVGVRPSLWAPYFVTNGAGFSGNALLEIGLTRQASWLIFRPSIGIISSVLYCGLVVHFTSSTYKEAAHA